LEAPGRQEAPPARFLLSYMRRIGDNFAVRRNLDVSCCFLDIIE
jgi:hypothetical protein